MSKQVVPKEKVQEKRDRFSASMLDWLIEFVNEEAVKEERSFSRMVERLVWEARQYRKGLAKQSSKPTKK